MEQKTRNGIIAVGTPDEIVDLFPIYREMGVDQMMTWVQVGGLKPGKIVRSLKLNR